MRRRPCKGELGTADKARGLELMVRAASGETAELAAKACEFLGIEHLSGTGSPSGAQGLPSFAEGERWLRRGAELGSALVPERAAQAASIARHVARQGPQCLTVALARPIVLSGAARRPARLAHPPRCCSSVAKEIRCGAEVASIAVVVVVEGGRLVSIDQHGLAVGERWMGPQALRGVRFPADSRATRRRSPQ